MCNNTSASTVLQGNQQKPVNPSDEGISPHVDLETLPCVHLDETLLEMDDAQEMNHDEYDEYDFKKKGKEMKAKKILVTMKMEKTKKMLMIIIALKKE